MHAPPCIEHRYVPPLEPVAYSRHLFPPLYHSIYLSMKKQKVTGGKRVLPHVGSSHVTFEQSTKFWVHLSSKVWVYHDLRKLSSLLRFYSSNRLFFQSLWRVCWCLLHHKVLSLSLWCLSYPYVSCSCSKEVYKLMSSISQNSWICMSSIPLVYIKVTWSCIPTMHLGPTLIMGR